MMLIADYWFEKDLHHNRSDKVPLSEWFDCSSPSSALGEGCRAGCRFDPWPSTNRTAEALPYTHKAQSPTKKISLLLLIKLTVILDGCEDSCVPDLLQALYVL